MNANRIVVGDNLEVLRTLPDGFADLIYADPPFATGKDFGAFDDRWDDLDGYLDFMRPRLNECRRVLKASGSFYLHCDPTASHYLKVECDKIFGRNRFRNEIIWAYTGPSSPGLKQFPRKHDVLLFYSKTGVWTFNQVWVPYKRPVSLRKHMDGGRGIGQEEARRYDERGKPVEDWWTDITPANRIHKQITGYPTQKPEALLDRIIAASSNPDDLVVDPFSGSGTTLVAAKRLGRRWFGIDANPDAVALAERRVAAASFQQDLFPATGFPVGNIGNKDGGTSEPFPSAVLFPSTSQERPLEAHVRYSNNYSATC